MRFVKEEHKFELINLYHLAKVYCGDRHGRMIWASKVFVKKYPEYSKVKVYKDLCFLLEM